jgi:hypothetical protein
MKMMLVCRGSIETGVEDHEKGIDVLDYDVLINCLDSEDHSSTISGINNVIKIHKDIEQKVQSELYFDEIKVAGYLLRTEGLNPIMRHESKIEQKEGPIGPSGTCSCGSGKPYDECCKVLENI